MKSLQKALLKQDDSKLCKISIINLISRIEKMKTGSYLDKQATSIAALGRNELTRRIKNFRGRFKMDFTEDYLNKLSVDRLRHILLAALLNARQHN